MGLGYLCPSTSTNAKLEIMTSTLRDYRKLAPDLARGAALLGIAVANGITTWSATGLPAAKNELETYAGIIVDDSRWDKIMVVIGTLFVHVRGLPMFATLLGYGIGMILVREWRKGATPRSVRVILARRYGVLAIIGALHTVFLFYGDIMLTYGLIALVVVLICTFPDRILIRLVGVSAVVGAVLIAPWGYSPFDAVAPATPISQDGGSGYLIDQLYPGFVVLLRTPGQFFIDLVTLGPLILLGFIAGRKGVLEHPDRYVMPMRIAAGITVLVIVGVGIPWGLSALGVLPAEPFWHGINRVAGLWTGPGFVVWIFWVARWVQKRHRSNRLWIRMLAALGQMSMTGYVLQSVLFTIIMVPWGLAIGAGRGAATVTLIATGIWVVTMVFAYLWSLTTRRGPLEFVYRYFGYDPSSRIEYDIIQGCVLRSRQ